MSYDFLSNMPTSALHDFGIRFGPWEKIVHKVREFVSDGAKDWFIGKCNGNKAAEIISKKTENCYCIRSVPLDTTLIENYTYIFALSYWNDGKISHLRIFKDNKQHRLCALDETQQLQYVHSFKDIIEKVLKEKSIKSVGDPRFKNLLTEESIQSSTVMASPGYLLKANYVYIVKAN